MLYLLVSLIISYWDPGKFWSTGACFWVTTCEDWNTDYSLVVLWEYDEPENPSQLINNASTELQEVVMLALNKEQLFI
jgi:hypothetical protein